MTVPATDTAPTGAVWPRLTLSEWEGTKDTLHLWAQIVGKVRLALAPMVNHWWQVPLYVSARGLTTSLMPVGARGMEIQFDFIDHRLDLWTTDGQRRAVALEPTSVGEFFRAVLAALTVTATPRSSNAPGVLGSDPAALQPRRRPSDPPGQNPQLLTSWL